MWKRLVLVLIAVGAVFAWLIVRRAAPPQVPFTKVTRETLVSTLNTNGKVEPIEWTAVRAETSGAVERVHVQRGQPVSQGQLLVELSAADARAQLAAAEARISQINAELEGLRGGGRPTEQAEIESGLERARADLNIARQEYETLRRLADQKAATPAEVENARRRMEAAERQIQALERKRGALVAPADRKATEARLREAQSSAEAARLRLALSQIRAPMTGALYQFDPKPGAYLNPGDEVARIGLLGRLRVIVYVDEPELGRIAKDMPVTITWDALPGRQWKGGVERIPTQVVRLGTRQVGEVICIIENPDLSLLPGTNINAEIRSRVVEGALTIPKEALRRQRDQSGVLKLAGDRIRWQPVTLGISSVTRIQVLSGVAEGEAVALPVERPLQDNDAVTPVWP